MPTTDLRYTAFAIDLNPGQTRVLHCDYGEDLTGRTFEAVLDDIDLAVTVTGSVVDIAFDGADTEDLSTRLHHTWFLYDTTAGSDPLQIEFGGPVHLSTRGTQLPDASVVVTSRDITVGVTVLGEPGPPGSAGSGATAEEIQDVVGGMVAGTQTGIAVSYDDTAGMLDFAAEVTQAELDAEVTARADADAVIAAALSAETVSRANADTALDGRIDTLEVGPPAHAASHQDGGSDELALDGSQITTGTVADARIASTIARDSEVTAAIDALKNGAPAGGDTLAELDARIAVVEALGSLATDAELIAAVAALVGSADTAGDTLGELQALIGLRLLKSANLSDLANASTALTNLGLSANGKSLVTAADYAAMRTLLGLVIGVDVQAHDGDLDAIAAIATTAYGRSLLALANSGALGAELSGTYQSLASASHIVNHGSDNTVARPSTTAPVLWIGSVQPDNIDTDDLWYDTDDDTTSGVVAGTAPITYDSGTQTVGITAATSGAAGSMSAADKSKLDGIEAAADVTDAANVAAAGAVMNTGAETIAGVKTFSSAPVVPADVYDSSWNGLQEPAPKDALWDALGAVSAFVKTLLDDAAAGDFLTTLGVSAFVQTVLDDANAAAARATLGAAGSAGQTFTGAVVEAVVALTDGANIATDASLGNVFKVTLGGNRTMDNPTNPVAGQKIIYRLTQDGTGSRTITWGSAFRFSTDVPSPTLTTTASKADYIGFIYNGDASKWDCLAVNKGF